MQWCKVEAEVVPFLWPQIQAHVQRGLKRGYGETLTEDGILDAINDHRMHMLGLQGEDGSLVGAVIYAIEMRANRPVVVVIMVAGKWINGEAEKVQNIIKDYAHDIGADKIETFARLGQEPRLKSMGWKSKAVVMELEI